ncbi:hypothetical protein GUJ93_ZPchr0015g6915 [Zizania palustris]|uniref:Uncharacterized protein n=1 Tax=Zizania palustris TaxID=103762 RepID=A0A8J5TB27_ZIZPA|nr:hypothetical protein GUJ93_ZPchr0015g6915 [Zizania palustris]
MPSRCCSPWSRPMPRPPPPSPMIARHPRAPGQDPASTTMTGHRNSNGWIFPGTTARLIPSSSSTTVSPTSTGSGSWRKRRSGWPPTTWRTGRRCGTYRSKRTRVLRHGTDSRSCTTCATALLFAMLLSSNLQIVVALAPSRSIKTASRRFFPTSATSTRHNESNCSRAAFFLRSASTSRSTRRLRPWSRWTADRRSACPCRSKRSVVGWASASTATKSTRGGTTVSASESSTSTASRSTLLMTPRLGLAQTQKPQFSSCMRSQGVPIDNTAQLRVVLGIATFIELIDTGSTHNLIEEAASRLIGLRIKPCQKLMATVANGERVSCPGVLR